MTSATTSFEAFAENYDERMGDTGDGYHSGTIDPALFEGLGDLYGKKAYDIGCGNGYISRRIVREGASEVWASDVSNHLIDIAKTKYDPAGIKYMVRDGNDFKDIPHDHFDIVVVSMAVHYIENFQSFVANVRNVLKPGGIFVASIVHPLDGFEWYDLDPKIENLDRAMEQARNYRTPREVVVKSPWLKTENLKVYQRPIGFYLQIFAGNGFTLEHFIEPPTMKTEEEDGKKIVKRSEIPFIYVIRERLK